MSIPGTGRGWNASAHQDGSSADMEKGCVCMFLCARVVRVGDRVTELLLLAFVCARVNGRPIIEKRLGSQM